MTFAPAYRNDIRFKRGPVRSRSTPRDGSGAETAPAPDAQPLAFAAPTRGLMLFDDIAAVSDGGALVLDNFFPEADSARVRRGSIARNTGLSQKIKALAVYNAGTTQRLFVVAEGAQSSIYEASSPGAIGAALISGLTNASWSPVQMTTSGGAFLRLFGFGNAPRIYDGTTWGTAPAITGPSVNNVSQGWTHGNRLWMVEGNTQNAWYLAIDAIGGAATKFPLGGEFKEGGSLVAGASWTADGAQGGPNVSCVFVSSNGEVLVYEGADPATWSIRGVYKVGRPLGINCFFKTGGDLAIMTEDGLFAMSQVLRTDRAALMTQAMSRNIAPLWSEAARATPREEWLMVRRDNATMALVCVPKTPARAAVQYAVNLQTGAWSRFTGWDVSAMAVLNGDLIFGTNSGKIQQGEIGGSDEGVPYTAQFMGPFRLMGIRRIVATMMRAVWRTNVAIAPVVQAAFDYAEKLPTPPSAAFSPGFTAKWGPGGAKWGPGGGKWGGGRKTVQNWVSVSGEGSAIAPAVAVTMGTNSPPDVRLTRIDCAFRPGSVP